MNERKIFLKFSIFQIFYFLSIGIVIPFFSLILKEANWSIQNITYFFSFSAFVVFFLGPIIGKISDEIGKKRIMIVGLFIQIITFILFFIFIENEIFSLIIRFIYIFAEIFVGIVGISIIEDLINNKRGFWTGFFMSVGSIGSLLGPILAGLITDNFQNKHLLLFSIPLTAIALIALSKIKEPNKSHQKIEMKYLNPFFEIKDFLSYKKLKGMGLLGILMNSKVQLFTIFFPILIVEQLKYSKTTLGILLAIPAAIHIFQFIFGKIADKISSEFGVLLGVIIVVFSLLNLPHIENISGILFVVILYGIGTSIWNVNALSLMGEIGKKYSKDGEIFSSYVALSKLGVGISTLISASLISFFNMSEIIQFFAILTLLSAIVSYFFFSPIFHHEKHGSYFKSILNKN
jgi:MFS family permease